MDPFMLNRHVCHWCVSLTMYIRFNRGSFDEGKAEPWGGGTGFPLVW